MQEKRGVVGRGHNHKFLPLNVIPLSPIFSSDWATPSVLCLPIPSILQGLLRRMHLLDGVHSVKGTFTSLSSLPIHSLPGCSHRIFELTRQGNPHFQKALQKFRMEKWEGVAETGHKVYILIMIVFLFTFLGVLWIKITLSENTNSLCLLINM